MISREEKNKKVFNEIRREHQIEISKKIFKIFFIIALLYFILFSYVYFIGTKGLITKEYVVKSKQLPDSFNGIKALHFSDLLYGNNIDEDYLNSFLKEIKKINPDIVFFTGNLINNRCQVDEKDHKIISQFLKDIPYTIGKYAIKGDKDGNAFNVIFDETDFEILSNEVISIYNNSQEYINIVGLNNNSTQVTANGKSGYTISLINNYDYYEKYNVNSNLILAGHNLGGEIRILNIPLINKSKYTKDHYKNSNNEVFISSGIGSIHHMRFMNHPSINVYRLYK